MTNSCKAHSIDLKVRINCKLHGENYDLLACFKVMGFKTESNVFNI